ncbi:MAG: MarR family transcriptional regulator [Acidobacteriota bacterium]
MEIEKLVLTTLGKSDKPLKGKEIAELAGVEKKDVDKAIKTLKKEEKIFSPKNCFYSVKK